MHAALLRGTRSMAKAFGSYSYFGNPQLIDYQSGAPISDIFISYSRDQAAWVEGQLVPVLIAGGADVPVLHPGGGEELVDTERSAVGAQTAQRVLAAQDQAERQIIILSEEYVGNVSCLDQLRHAIAKDPDFRYGLVVPVLREDCALPEDIRIPERLIIDLRNDRRATPWDQLMSACQSDLGTSATAWLKARDEVIRHFSANRSVNLVIDPNLDQEVLLDHLRERIADLTTIDVNSFKAGTRRGLVTEILRVAGYDGAVPTPPADLEMFDQYMAGAGAHRIVVLNFDFVKRRLDFDQALFESLAAAISAAPAKLVLLLVSQQPLSKLLLAHNPVMKLNLPVVVLASQAG